MKISSTSKFIFGGTMSGERILVVDDDLTTAHVMQLYLENFGFKVAGIAHTGAEAIEKTKQLKPDLVLMDINLGEKGLDGIDAAEVIMQKFDIPVIYVTAYNDEDTLERAQMSNPYGFINKPLRDTDLKTTVRFALDKSNKDPDSKKKPSLEEALRQAYNLSRAEARVVSLLVEDPDVEVVAEKLNLSVSTIRTHLKHSFRKTGTKSLSVLLHKVITGPVALLVRPDKPDTK
ncbi:MAG: response regulator [Proteobacteria bacterium]|nr:response regulator [Pseudomonadota bacterium]